MLQVSGALICDGVVVLTVMWIVFRFANDLAEFHVLSHTKKLNNLHVYLARARRAA